MDTRAIKRLVPARARPYAKRAYLALTERDRAPQRADPRPVGGPGVRTVALSDEHLITFLVHSRAPLEHVEAHVSSAGGVTVEDLEVLSRYVHDGRHHVLAVLRRAVPLRPGDRITLSGDVGVIDAHAARVKSTSDATYPLIDRLVLTKSGDGFRISPGVPRVVALPALTAVDVAAAGHDLTLTLTVPAVRARLCSRTDQAVSELEISPAGQLVITGSRLEPLVARAVQPDVLTDLTVTTPTAARQRVVHADPWVRNPRNLQTFRAVRLPAGTFDVVVRPYWTLQGDLAVKLTKVT